jgi:hypothetical protein
MVGAGGFVAVVKGEIGSRLGKGVPQNVTARLKFDSLPYPEPLGAFADPNAYFWLGRRIRRARDWSCLKKT